jgi:hypothetical protein
VPRRIVEIRYSGTDNVYKTKSFRCQNSDTRLYLHALLGLLLQPALQVHVVPLDVRDPTLLQLLAPTPHAQIVRRTRSK